MTEHTQKVEQLANANDPATRLRLLATAAKFSAILAVLGVSNTILTNDANAHDHKDKAGENELKASNINVPALKKLLEFALSSGSMEEAIKKYGKKGFEELQKAGREGASEEQKGAIKDKHLKKKK